MVWFASCRETRSTSETANAEPAGMDADFSVPRDFMPAIQGRQNSPAQQSAIRARPKRIMRDLNAEELEQYPPTA
jgi:hypothetical protein